MTRPSVLLVDDDPGLLRLLSMRLAASGYRTLTSESGGEALSLLSTESPSVVITDLRMEPMDGMTLFGEIKKEWPNTPVIMLTAHGTIREAVAATQQGLFSFLTKPVDKNELLTLVKQALDLGGAGFQPVSDWSVDIITQSDFMLKRLEQARLLARSDINILVQGESGTGKELMARSVHNASPRAQAPFVAVNCSAIPGDLLESELFGHVKGAFTGATQSRDGLFMAADGGTLFLDEIGDMPASLQAKLLRVIQEQTLRPLGDDRDRQIDVRVVSATHWNLEKAIREQRFREDLYYRLNVATIGMPPLRDRKEDIPLLTKHFMEAIAKRTGGSARNIAPRGNQLLMQYDWPGNIRQLRNVIEQLVALSTSPMIPESLIKEVLPGEQAPLFMPLKDAKQAFERDYVAQLLRTTQGNVSEAARLSGRNRSDFHRIMKRHHLNSDSFKPSRQ